MKDINPGSASSAPGRSAIFGGKLYFPADNGVNGKELFSSDGTEGGTVLAADIRAGSSSSFPNELTVFNGFLFFQATDGVNGIELWKSDGTQAGTTMAANINSGSSSTPNNLVVFGGKLFFVADAGGGSEVHFYDGTNSPCESSNPPAPITARHCAVFLILAASQNPIITAPLFHSDVEGH